MSIMSKFCLDFGHIATYNGDPSNMTAFHSKERAAFNGLVLAIVRSVKGEEGVITVTARSDGLEGVSVEMKSR